MFAGKCALLGLIAMASAAVVSKKDPNVTPVGCRMLPGDEAWPKAVQWERLNRTVGGRLITSIPYASVCHDAPFQNYNADGCATIQAEWNETKLAQYVYRVIYP